MIAILSLVVIFAVFVHGQDHHGHTATRDLISDSVKAKMCDPAIMSDELAVKLDKCDDLYETEVDKDTQQFENLSKDCEKKDLDFVAKFKKLKKEDNRHHLHDTCDELDDKCYDKYIDKIKEVGIKHKKLLNDCYSKVFVV